MKKYAIINIDAIQKRIEELEKFSNSAKKIGLDTGNIDDSIDLLNDVLSQSTPLIPEIKKAFDENKNEQPIYYEDNGCNCGQPSCTFGCA